MRARACTYMCMHVGMMSQWALIHTVSLADPHWTDQTRPNEWSFTLQPYWTENSVVDSSELWEILHPVHELPLWGNVYWKHLLLVTWKTSWLHRINTRHNSWGEYHNHLDDLMTKEGFEDTSEWAQSPFKFMKLICISVLSKIQILMVLLVLRSNLW